MVGTFVVKSLDISNVFKILVFEISKFNYFFLIIHYFFFYFYFFFAERNLCSLSEKKKYCCNLENK